MMMDWTNILDYDWHTDVNTVSLYVHLLAMADENGKVDISRRAFCKLIGISERQYRTALSRLEATHIATHETTQQGTRITICNIDSCKRTKVVKRPTKRPSERPTEITLVPTSTKVKKQEETIDYQQFMQYFNYKVSGTEIPTIRNLSEARKRLLRARLREHGKHSLADVLDKVIESDFLSGRAKKWHASFDWIFKAANFQKILEDNYKNGNNIKSGVEYSRESALNAIAHIKADIRADEEFWAEDD